jgi:hypothetical protein
MIRNKRTTFAACINSEETLIVRSTVPRLAGPVVDDTSPAGRAVRTSCHRPATATQRLFFAGSGHSDVLSSPNHGESEA